MGYHVCSSPSSIFHDFYRISSSSSSSSFNFKPRNTASPFQSSSPLAPLSRTFLHATNRVSLQEPIPKLSKEANSEQVSEFEDPDVKSSASSKNYVWVNPRSPRAKQLRKKSYDARYTSLLEFANSLDSCNPTEHDVSQVLEGLGGLVLEQDAVIVLNNMVSSKTAPLVLKYFQKKIRPTREAILYNVTLKVFRKCKDLDGAEALFDEMLERRIKPDNVTFSTIISCARVCQLPNRAVEWFEKMHSFGCEPDEVTYSAMIDVYGRAGNIDKAMKLYDRARTEKWRIDTITFSSLIKMYGMAGNYDGCLNVYEEMKVLKVKPNMVIYNTLLDGMGRAKRPLQAKSIYKEMINNGFSPTWATYAALLRAYGRSRFCEDALIVYKEMKEKGMEMNTNLYNTLLAMCADVGYVDEAFKIYQDLKSSGTCEPDSWTFSSLITTYSCWGKVSEAEKIYYEMIESGFEPTIFVLTSLAQCYGKAKRTDDVVKIFNQLLGLGITPDDRFCGCLLNVMTQIPREDLVKITDCVEKANPKLGSVLRYLIDAPKGDGDFKQEASELFNSIVDGVKKAFCNCLIDLCINLDLLDRACELLDLGLTRGIYAEIRSKSETQWTLYVKSLSLGAALTAFHVWVNDLSKALESGEELPPMLGINTGHGKHKYSEKGLATVFEEHLKELNAPFHEAPDKAGWFFTTRLAATSWLESKGSPQLVAQ